MASTSSSSAEGGVAIHWFRNGFRFHDNPSLVDACKHKSVLLLSIIDPESPFSQSSGRSAGAIRANFVLESQKEMDTKLRTNHKEQQLVVIKGKPEEVLPQIVCDLQATDLYYEREPAAPTRERDGIVLEAIRIRLEKGGNLQTCSIHGYDTHTLFPVEHYLARCKGGVAPSTYGSFTKIFNNMGPVPSELDVVTNIPPMPTGSLAVLKKSFPDTPEFQVPSLTSLGYDEAELKDRGKGGIDFIGGEDAGIALLDQMMKRTTWVSTFEKPKTKPNSLTVDTTGLSPYVKHGLVSPRRFYHELSKVYAKVPASKVSQPPVSLHGQLMWRDYNNLMGYTTPNFEKMLGNPVARQIPWDDDPIMLDAWVNAQTGYPFIDAIMTQLKETGFIHHLARHAVACFLTRGDLWQSWEDGAAVFEERLIDADWSLNNFNWQWLSCTAHFYQYFRCYSPVAFGKKTDPNGDYIRKWLPKFRNFPTKYIYEPWTAPIAVQKSAGLIIGKDYPQPIVDHKTISKSNMNRMKQAYAAAKEAQSALSNDTTSSSARKGEASSGAAKKRRKT